MFVCGNVVPYMETYDGIRSLHANFRCECYAKDEAEISLYTYYEDLAGSMIKIKIDAGTTARSEHRWILWNPDEILYSTPAEKLVIIQDTIDKLNAYLNDNTPTDNIDSVDYYNYRYYLPLSINTGAVTWERNPTSFWSRVEITDPADWINPNADIPTLDAP